ncbi:CAP domain-containing protein [Saccharothrix syringae]|uniref:CAP domain-containing protein n=1 Tax=Saccharothrix syringae TaxID=103733 RepID=A0A5Q0H7I3_SACSY|nr:CAP domain-containing protein [Saccharothrix syringae]QFZ21933.1 CAP domain-containing protein [Saccharothrix syringae]
MTPKTVAVATAIAALFVTTSTATAAPTYDQSVLTLTNQERTAAGCPALSSNDQLIAAAKRHNDEMAATGNFSHTGVDGSTPAQRVSEAGYPFRTTAENIAAGQRTPEEVVRDWMASEGHRANILNCELRELGVAYAVDAGGRSYWTQEFGVRQ